MSAIQFVKSLQLLGGKNKEITSWKGDANPENEKEQTIPDVSSLASDQIGQRRRRGNKRYI